MPCKVYGKFINGVFYIIKVEYIKNEESVFSENEDWYLRMQEDEDGQIIRKVCNR